MGEPLKCYIFSEWLLKLLRLNNPNEKDSKECRSEQCAVYHMYRGKCPYMHPPRKEEGEKP